MELYDDFIKKIKDLKHKRYYVVECPVCHKKFLVEFNDFERIMFEPVEKEEEYYEGPNWEKHTRIVKVSSDASKDIFRISFDDFEDCQHTAELTREEFNNLDRVDWDGTNNIHFELSEKESENAKKFMEKHRDTCTKKQNLTLGEYFSYHIMPTGLGLATSIECNLCGETENLTDYDQW